MSECDECDATGTCWKCHGTGGGPDSFLSCSVCGGSGNCRECYGWGTTERSEEGWGDDD